MDNSLIREGSEPNYLARYRSLGRASVLNIVIIGGGIGGCALLTILSSNKAVRVLGVADIDPKAPGLKMARQQEIPTTSDFKSLITQDNLDVVIDVTGNPAVAQEINKLRRPQVEVMGGQMAKVIWGIIDEWNHKAEALQETKAYLQNVMDYAHDMVITTDLDSRIVAFNRGAETTLGYHREEVIGEPITNLYVDKKEREWLKEQVQKKGGVSNFETRLKRKDGTIVDIILSLSVLKDFNAKTIGTVGISKDVTELRNTKETLKMRNTELEELNRGLEQRIRERTLKLEKMNSDLQNTDKLKTEFLSCMSHELKTPLNSMLALSDILLDRLDGELNSEQEKQVRMIQTGGRHLNELVSNLLDLSRIEAGELELHYKEFDLEEALRSTMATMKPIPSSNKCSLELKTDGGPLRLVSDRSKVEQICINLFSNAMKFSPKGGVINVGTHQNSDSEYISVYVEDYGIGISKDDQLFIFEKFRQAATIGKRKNEGAGLGLAITKKINGN